MVLRSHITRQTTASAEQSGKGRVSAKPDHWRQTVVAVYSLAAYQGAHPVQDGTLDIQDMARIVSAIPGRSATTSTTDRYGPPTLHCWLYHEHKLHWLHVLSLWLRPLSGTVYRPMSGRAPRCWLSDAVWKLNILPLRIRNVYVTSWRSTNSVIIIIFFYPR